MYVELSTVFEFFLIRSNIFHTKKCVVLSETTKKRKRVVLCRTK